MRLSREASAREAPLPEAFVLVAKQASALRLTAVTAAAEAEGLFPGLSLADARARLPDVLALTADPAADAVRLERIAEACRRYTPALAVDAPDGVVLDISGAAHLFGGEAGLMADLRRRVTGAGYAARIAIADTPGLAWAFARAWSEDRSAPIGGGNDLLEALSPAALRLDPEALKLLRRLGVRRISQFSSMPRAALARRLGTAFLDRLDQALGRRASPLQARLEVEPWQAARRLL